MFNDIQLFRSPDFEVQTIADEHSGEPLFRARHVSLAIGLANPSQPYKRISPEFKVICNVDSPGGQQAALFLREAGVWELLTTARLRKDNPNKDRVHAFRRWLFSEVLPAIRKTGGYGNPQPPAHKLAHLSDEIEASIRIAKMLGFEGNMATLSVVSRMRRDFGVDLGESFGLALPSPGNKVQRTATEVGKAVGERTGDKLSPQKVNDRLFEAGWQVKHPSGKGWLPTDLGKEKGGVLLDATKSHGRGKPVQQLVWIGDEVIELLCQAKAAPISC